MKLMRTTVASIVAVICSLTAVSTFAAASLTGAGATFPAPVYAKWADSYQKETGNKVNYQDRFLWRYKANRCSHHRLRRFRWPIV